MVSNISQCSYSQDGTNLSPLSDAQLPLIKQNGQQDVSQLVGRIVNTYLKYTGAAVYNVTLKRDSITFALEDGSEQRQLRLNGTKWELVSGGATTAVDDTLQLDVTRDITQTLAKIRNVATGALPAASAATTPASSTGGSSGTNVNVYVNGQPTTSIGGSPTHQAALVAGNRQAEADRARMNLEPERAHVDLRPESRKKKVAKFVGRQTLNLAKGTLGLGWRATKGLASALWNGM
jgi:hypothetical protein